MKTRTLTLYFVLVWLFNVMLFVCWIRPSTEPAPVCGHTTLNAPRLVWPQKLSRLGPGEYLDGRTSAHCGPVSVTSLPGLPHPDTSLPGPPIRIRHFRGFPIHIRHFQGLPHSYFNWISAKFDTVDYRGRWKCTTLASGEEEILFHSITPGQTSNLFFIKSQ